MLCASRSLPPSQSPSPVLLLHSRQNLVLQFLVALTTEGGDMEKGAFVVGADAVCGGMVVGLGGSGSHLISWAIESLYMTEMRSLG